MRIKPDVSFISQVKLEQFANKLLRQYDQQIEPILVPPVPVEKIADFLLELAIDWLDIADSEDEPVLAYLHPASQAIRFNERRLPYFEQHPGTYEFTLAHELGHYILHLTAPEDSTAADPGSPEPDFLCRYKSAAQNQREWQAEQFASYLLMPAYLLLPALEWVNIHTWPGLYRLRDQFQVSITAIRIRLEKLGYLHLAANGQIYPHQTDAAADLQQAYKQWISQGNLHSRLGRLTSAQEAFQQALQIARDLGDRQREAFCAWELGRLYIETNPKRAVALMTLCVTYEREIGHAEAERDAALVAQIAASI